MWCLLTGFLPLSAIAPIHAFMPSAAIDQSQLPFITSLRVFGVTGDWRTAALDPGAWYNKVQEGCRFMAAWVREEENASNQRQKKREVEEVDKVEVAPAVTVVASLRRFRTALLIGPTQGLPKRRRLCRW